MKRFTELFLALDATTRTNEKLAALRDYFQSTPLEDAAWAVWILAGNRAGRAVPSRLLRELAVEVSGLPAWLLDECYHLVGDQSETFSLILPDNSQQIDPPPLHVLFEEVIQPLRSLPQDKVRPIILQNWSRMNADQRLVFHKLLGGEFRIGVSRQNLIRALADVAGVEASVIAHRLAGKWQPSVDAMKALLASSDANAPTDPNLPFPFMLAHALTDPLDSLGPTSDWLIEWKWDGIRAQLIRRAGKTLLWSRGDEMVASAFPEIIHAAHIIPEGTVIDGEILAWEPGENKPLPFTRLQRRLNRQGVDLSFWPEVPVTFAAFDLLEADGKDLRNLPLAERRKMLGEFLEWEKAKPDLRFSVPQDWGDWKQAEEAMSHSRELGVEGVMLKRLDSTYEAGRPTGLWWKLKVQPYTVDAVMIAAQSGHGRRAGLLTDYTFAVWDAGQLVPVAKAYSGLTDKEITEVDRFARTHTLARHGPVHSVEPTRVFEIGFEAIQESTRHKSGVALRFPRILRIRDDKKAEEADQLATLRLLLKERG